MIETSELNGRAIRNLRALSLSGPLRERVAGHFLPAIERLDAILRARIRLLRGRNYGRVYLLGLPKPGSGGGLGGCEAPSPDWLLLVGPQQEQDDQANGD